MASDSANTQAPLTAIETAVGRSIERLGVTVDRALVQHVLPIALRCVDTEDKVATLRLFVDDLQCQVREEGSGDRASVDAVAEQLIARILYPRVVDRVCRDGGANAR